MIRSSPVRFVALAVGMSASLTGPAVSFAHGHAHGEAVEHASYHAHAVKAQADPTVGADEHDKDHAHPRLDPSVFTRVLKDFPTALASEPVAIAAADVSAREDTDAPEPNESPPDRPGVSPAHARAPPAL